MNKKTRKLLIISIVIVIIAVIFFLITHKEQNNFKGTIISPTESQEINNAQIKEANNPDSTLAKVIIFWSIDDEKSLDVLKSFNDFYNKYSESITFIAINTTDNVSKAASYLYTNNINIPSSNSINIDLEEIDLNNIETIPSYAFILKDGSLLDYKSKELSTDSLEAYLDILAENY
jgi:hypothetical protein